MAYTKEELLADKEEFLAEMEAQTKHAIDAVFHGMIYGLELSGYSAKDLGLPEGYASQVATWMVQELEEHGIYCDLDADGALIRCTDAGGYIQ